MTYCTGAMVDAAIGQDDTAMGRLSVDDLRFLFTHVNSEPTVSIVVDTKELLVQQQHVI